MGTPRSWPAEFRGNARFELRGRLGAGGMGIVYRALDRERGIEVALKVLANVSAAGIFRFKQEFRALADVSHPNLVSLYELFGEDDRWFFTMELIDGVDLLTWVCGAAPLTSAPPEASTQRATLYPSAETTETGLVAAPPVPGPPLRGRPMIGRLRAALPQLVAGVAALHDGGHLHQDVKPSNVLVTPEGRVVVMDFGVVAQLGTRRTVEVDGEAAGTPAYMAPEQAMAALPTTASDWYSVGVILYHALAGRLPYTGTSERILWDKVHSQPPPIRLSRPDVPEDLERLCMDLLRAGPEQRPTAAEILERLGAYHGDPPSEPRAPQAGAATAPEPDVALVGREAELARLRAAFARARAGEPAAIYIHGVSGVGKSSLVRTFLDEVKRDKAALVLAGRCYERESVPYKAVDTVVDDLCRHLLAAPPEEVAAVVPPDAALLATLFPVLRRLDAFAAEVDPELLHRPHRLRRRAFVALRTLLANLAARRPVVVSIDDLQWGDADSAPLVEAIMGSSVLVLGCYRTDEAHRSSLVQALVYGDGAAPDQIALDRLEPDDALALATTQLGALGADARLAGAIALESGGNAFFLHELVRFVAGGSAFGVARRGAVDAIPSLEAVIAARIDGLGAEARRLVELVAVAGRPVEQRVARAATAIDEADWPIWVQSVAAARVVRVTGRRGDDLIECYHDRIRETVVARLAAPALAKHHRALAVAHQESYRRDPETVAEHFAAAGDRMLAARYMLQAADLAAAALAFDRAIALYRSALELNPTGDADEQAIRLKLAAALANAGRGDEAAHLYLECANRSGGEHALDLRRNAAEQLLRSGHVDAGIGVLRDVLGSVGFKLPASAGAAIPSLLWGRFRLRLRGLEPPRQPRLGPGLVARLDACRSATMGLALFDPIRAAPFSTRHLRLALELGDPHRISFALAVEAGYHASAKRPRRATELLGRAEAIANQLQHPLLFGVVGMMRAILDYERGEFRAAVTSFDATEALLRDHFTGIAWELRTLQMFAVHALFFLGEFPEIVNRITTQIADARERGDLYAIMNLRSLAGPCLHIVADDNPALALEEMAEVERQLPASGFYVQHMFLLYGRSFADFYVGEYERAYRRFVETRAVVKRSYLLHDRAIHNFWSFLHGGAALGAATTARSPSEVARLVRVARSMARRIARDGARPYGATASILEAGAARRTGDMAAAVRHLEAAMDAFERSSMPIFAACARRRLGELVGGGRGAQLVAEVDRLLRENRVANPERGVRCLTPGFE